MPSRYLAAADIGATKITVSLADETGILVKAYRSIRLEGEPEEVPRQVDEIIRHCLDRVDIDKEQLEAVGVSSAGPFVKDANGNITLVSPNICGGLAKDSSRVPNDWVSIPLGSVLSKTYGKVRIGNDAVTGAVAERTFGAGQGEDDLVYVTWSTGIGTGAYVDGRPIKGKNGNAPHGGHIRLVEDGPQCGCGGYGHLEALASGTAIGREFGDDAIKCFDAYRHGDHRAKEIIEAAAGHFARGLGAMCVLFDTRMFILGGSVFFNNIEILLPLVRYEFSQSSWNVFSKEVSIVPAELRDHLPDMAALSLVMPREWIDDWRTRRPWENVPETEVLDP